MRSETETPVNSVDIAANRAARKYTHREMARRVLWAVFKPLYRFSPRPCFAWRRMLLRFFGARVGAKVNIYPSAAVYFPWNLAVGDWSAIGEHAYIYNLGYVTIGARVTISQRAHLCAGSHDYTDPTMPLEKPSIDVGDQVWICADAFVGPGVHVGQGAVVAACAVVVKDVPEWAIVGGNPARFIKRRVLARA